jgi:hypothetical protein
VKQEYSIRPISAKQKCVTRPWSGLAFPRFYTAPIRRKTAAAVIIGDEILNGMVLDKNTHFLANFLFSHGIEFKKVEIVPDQVFFILCFPFHKTLIYDLI